MATHSRGPAGTNTPVGDSALAGRLAREIEGEVLFDPFSRGRYSTDASHYQIEPIGVVVPKTADDIPCVIEIAANEGVPVLPRGGGTSQCGQTVGEAVVVDVSKHLNRILDFDPEGRTAWVEPGLVLDQLNAFLKPHGLWFPVDVSTSSRATLGGMTGNNSCGARSIRYGPMRDNVRAIEAVLMDGETMHFGELSDNVAGAGPTPRQQTLTAGLLDLGRRETEEIKERFPDLMRRVGGYNIDALMPGGPGRGDWAKATVGRPQTHPNLAHLLVGSEGTLAFSTRIQIDLQPLPAHKVLGVCHFPTFFDAMDSSRHIVELDPAAVELVDRTMIDLARDIPLFRPAVERFVRGQPEALLLVEFAGQDRDVQLRSLKRLGELMGDLGFPGAVLEAVDADSQKAVWEVRKAGLNIMMSMKGDGKPISFIEDCAVRLEDLAEYTSRLTDIFHKHGTIGTWYAHASVGCLHVRPVLNLKSEIDVKKMRDIAEEAFAMVREYKGSHSGEHGDGLVRSEFHQSMFGNRMTQTFEEIKDSFDPEGLLNPGKIVRPSKMDDRSLFRYKPGYQVPPMETAFDWSDWGGFGGAVEMCNNNGACRKFDAGVMCPSFRATGDEKHLTRGRANTLRLALSGQLGADAFASDALFDTMKLCVGCKACKRECPTGVDITKMKMEFLHHYNKRHGLRLFDCLVAYLPRYAPWASRLGPILNLRDKVPGMAGLSEVLFGFSAKRKLPPWRRDPFKATEAKVETGNGPEVVLWADTFNTYFEPESARAALRVLQAAGFRVHLPRAADGGRPLCCGRTFLAAGLIDEAKIEARRMLGALKPFVERGVPVVGLEPSCLFTLSDEFKAMLPDAETDALAGAALTFEEFLSREQKAGNLKLNLRPLNSGRAIVHGHCHQKAFAVMDEVKTALRLVPDLEIEIIDSGCCGMAGAFGYDAGNYDISMTMAENGLLPAVRGAPSDTLIVAGGTSCRHQIRDGAGREAVHVARVLEKALDIE
ncbi:MAG: FAD-binding oxidoreductase [Rhodospirillaceae bacterium]|jgi:FAD/FMN-containing dehydrogenase/Fe-S oxidoreductase|nr:FAD-binding oxidoreductase [Rhodospirillaceae bacterium]|tara:strand:- start:6228 stop:9209 length:2982 start_codon:yes stop_codon:yes gene_type:complete